MFFMIKPISVVNNNSYNVVHKSHLEKIQNEIDRAEKKTNNSDDVKTSTLSCIAGLVLTLLAIGATVATAVKANKEKGAKQIIENVIPIDTLKQGNKTLNILK